MNAKVNPTPITANEGIIDLDLSVTAKKKFRINKDDNRILELNTSDMGIIRRISETYPKLQELQAQATKLTDGIDLEKESEDISMEDTKVLADRLEEIDQKMREYIDYMFNANVSEITAPDGSMYDPFGGTFRYQHIMNLLMTQYETNLQSEFGKIEKQMKKHTDKYLKG